jgi:spermidine/putrescine transport system ATP-binding protein
VTLDGVTKRFQDVVAVDNVTLNVIKGEFLCILGPSGCGKTTTMRLIAGFEKPDNGVIKLAGMDVTSIPPDKRNTRMVFQNYALFPHMSVYDNVAFGLRMARVPKNQIEEKVMESLAIVELEGYEKRKPHQLSGGQQQRIALARAIVTRPTVLLLDEPLGALDLKLRKQMQIELKTIQEEVGITFIYVTHDQDESLTMADRIAVMKDGHIEQIGTPIDIYERPINAYVCDFVGVINMLDGIVIDDSGEEIKIKLGAGTEVQLPNNHDLTEGQNVIIGVRPEKIVLSRSPNPEYPISLPCQVDVIVYQGTHTGYTLKLPDGKKMNVMVQNLSGGEYFSIKDAIHLHWTNDAIQVFPQ